MKEAMDVLKLLAEKLGTTTEYLWRVLVAQGKLELGLRLGFGVVSLISGLLLIWRGVVEVRKTKAGDLSGFGFACLFIGVISVLIALSAIGSIRTPEAWALQEVLRIFGR